jgi:hypothetical protein
MGRKDEWRIEKNRGGLYRRPKLTLSCSTKGKKLLSTEVVNEQKIYVISISEKCIKVLCLTVLYCWNYYYKTNKMFWEELITCIPFTAILVSDTRSRNKTIVYMCNEVSKTIQFWRLQCWYYWFEWFIIYTIEMASDDMIYVPSFMKISLGIQVILRHYLYNLKGRSVGITNGKDLWCMLLRWPQMAWHIQSFMKIGSGIQMILRVLPQQFERQ